MRLAARLTLFIGLTALAPLVLFGVSATQLVGSQTQRHIAELQGKTVVGLALSIDTWLSRSLSVLQLQSSSFDPLALSEDKRLGYLRLIYRQTTAAQIVALTSPAGELLAAPLYLRAPSAAFPHRSAVSDAQRDAFLATIRAAPLPEQIRVGEPYRSPGRAVFALPVSVPLQDGRAGLHVELALEELTSWLVEQGGSEMEIGLMDRSGQLFLASGDALLVADNFRAFLKSDLSADIDYTTPDGVEVLASSAVIPQTGWRVIAAAPADIVTASRRSVQARTAYIAAVLSLVSVVWGVFFARQIVRPIVALKDAALGVAEGRLDVEVPDSASVDEVAELSEAFEVMSRSLKQSAEEIAKKNEEIGRFNQELQQRVEERTQQLQQAQVQLVRSERLAAVGELSAGIAHELNNPMAGILGLAQILRAQKPEDPLLQSIEEQALRCRDILSHLNQLTDRPSEAPDRDVIDFESLLQGVYAVVREQLSERGVEVHLAALPPMKTVGDRAALGRALSATLLGLRGLFPPSGGRLSVTAHQKPGQVGVRITAEGARPPGGDDWMASGMGLWAARQIFSQHRGGLLTPEDPADLAFVVWLQAEDSDA